MKTRCHTALALALLPFALWSQAQNLVPNGDFETYTLCPTSFSQTVNATPWVVPTGGTSDYFNACATPASAVDVPNNQTWFGWQWPVSGNGYCGGVCYGLAYREYIQAPLTAPLVAGITYEGSMYVSLGNQHQYGIEEVGMHLSVGPVTAAGAGPLLCCPPQVEYSSGPITDTLNWTFVSGTFVAAGGENYVTVGGFRADAACTVVMANPIAPWPYAYYYFEDVCVGLPGTCNIVLPVELLSLKAQWQGRAALLEWVTGAELNSDYFEVEHSATGSDFISVGKVQAAGESSGGQAYSFTDENADLQGANYYRLRLADASGKVRFSDMVLLSKGSNNPGWLKAYPVPAGEAVTIDFKAMGEGTLQVVNLQGVTVLEEQVQGQGRLQPGRLSPGCYLAFLTTETERHSTKFIVGGQR